MLKAVGSQESHSVLLLIRIYPSSQCSSVGFVSLHHTLKSRIDADLGISISISTCPKDGVEITY